MQQHRGVHHRVRVAQRAGQCAGEGGQHRVQQVRLDQARPPNGLTNLLLVDPALGELPGDVQPVRRWRLTRPGHPLAWLEGVQLGQVGVQGWSGGGQQVDEHRGAEPPQLADPAGIERVEERHQRHEVRGGRERHGARGRIEAVSTACQLA